MLENEGQIEVIGEIGGKRLIGHGRQPDQQPIGVGGSQGRQPPDESRLTAAPDLESGEVRAVERLGGPMQLDDHMAEPQADLVDRIVRETIEARQQNIIREWLEDAPDRIEEWIGKQQIQIGAPSRPRIIEQMLSDVGALHDQWPRRTAGPDASHNRNAGQVPGHILAPEGGRSLGMSTRVSRTQMVKRAREPVKLGRVEQRV